MSKKSKIKKTDLNGLSLVSDHPKEVPAMAKDRQFAQTFVSNDGELVLHFRNFKNKKRWFVFSVVEVDENGNFMVPEQHQTTANEVVNNIENHQPEE